MKCNHYLSRVQSAGKRTQSVGAFLDARTFPPNELSNNALEKSCVPNYRNKKNTSGLILNFVQFISVFLSGIVDFL